MSDKSGSAFPGLEGIAGYGNSLSVKLPNGEFGFVNLNQGMSLRAWFAGMALQGLLAYPNAICDKGAIVTDAVECADALLAELEKMK